MAIKTVAVVGASGNLGSFILNALLSSSNFQTTALVRESSKSEFPDFVKTRKIPDDFQPQEALVTALKGQDAIVLAFPGGSTAQSVKIIDAAIEAGVKRIIPADYGSCDSSDARSLEIVPLYKEKEKVRNYLIECEGKGEGQLSWTSLITGHFFDYGLRSNLLGMNIQDGIAKIFDKGDKMWSSTTREGIGMAVRAVLESSEDEEKLRNKLVYIQQVRTCQNDLLRVLENVTAKTFSVDQVDSDRFIEEHKKKLYKADGKLDGHVVEELVSVEGMVNGDWQEKGALVNDILGIQTEDVEAIVRRLLKDH